MRISLAPRRLFGRVAFLIVGIALLQFAVTIFLYDRISRDSVREDHARRVAELLEVSERLAVRGEADLAKIMSTKHLQVWLTARAAVASPSDHDAARKITDLVHRWEPDLADAPLYMAVERSGGRDHLVGSMRLDGGTWLNFRSTNLSSPWPIIATATIITLILSGLCVLFAVLALRQLGAPLRHLAEATAHIGEGAKITLLEEGSSDLRNLSRAFNMMQDRIAGILSDQTRSLVAISHDLRTPLARLRLTADLVEPEDMRQLAEGSVGEMEAMIASLQAFLKVQEATDRATPASLGEIVRLAAARWSEQVRIEDATGDARIVTYPDIVRLALEPLIENAVQYGGTAWIRIVDESGVPIIRITDAGPGIDEAHLGRLIEPFFRVDATRARNTPGFGLGIPRAHRLLQRFGGALTFRRDANGSLEVVVQPPRIDLSAP